MSKLIIGLFDRIFVVMGALSFSQIPHFFQHYIQRLGGHVAELSVQLEALQQAANSSGKTLQAYIQKFLSQTDLDFTSQGEMMQSMMARYANLDQAYYSLTDATAFSRPFVFLEYFQADIARMTLSDFTFGLTFSVEALVYAFLGLCAGYFFFRFLAIVVAWIFRRRVRRDRGNA